MISEILGWSNLDHSRSESSPFVRSIRDFRGRIWFGTETNIGWRIIGICSGYTRARASCIAAFSREAGWLAGSCVPRVPILPVSLFFFFFLISSYVSFSSSCFSYFCFIPFSVFFDRSVSLCSWWRIYIRSTTVYRTRRTRENTDILASQRWQEEGGCYRDGETDDSYNL